MKNYKKYRWFFTSSGRLVVGGKSSGSNDSLLKEILKHDINYIVTHTSHPGSPFCIIIDEKPGKKDVEEAATYTGCFSRAWKQGKRKTEVHLFKSSQLYKEKRMKSGTWGVLGKVEKVKVDLELVLVKQKKVYRAVPEKSVKKKDILLRIKPGKVLKEKKVNEILDMLREKKSKKDELLSALPAGGIKIIQ